MTASASIRLLCPGLLGPLPVLPQPMPSVAAIERLLGRADRSGAEPRDPFALLFDAFGLHHADERDLPSAPISLLGEGVEVEPDAYWLHADPIHLRPDRDRLLLFAGEAFAPTPPEADALIEGFNAHFADEGLHLIAPTPARWYLRVEGEPPPPEIPLHRLLGQPLDPLRPRTPESRRWSSLLNEIQMLFHAHPVNQARMDQGRPSISGIWTWGGGRLPGHVETDLDAVVGDHPLLFGLGRLAGLTTMRSEEALPEPVMGQGGTLVFWDSLWNALRAHDLDAWASGLEALEAWMLRMEVEVRRRHLSVLEIQTCDGQQWAVGRRHLRRFWRRVGFGSRLQLGRPDAS
ncbi:phosphoglycerate mutase [Imhoffiella purpurea]|uniref:Regulatory protein, RpfE type n=1 Tax=Imhoffiella purpurea TaxID=1249627 RepID=W9VCG6_9GAMM|nr:phosphoglycerate mutase [Imhoffiella purpurea]EXJ14681.1 Regulatory protein, RpfE type [Imhoffiella purpurea]